MKNDKISANNKVAIVTGSATGIGYEVAAQLARKGFRTYATMRNLQKAKEIKEIAETENLPLRAIQLDVTNDASIDKAIDTVISESGRIDVLVNNAGYGLLGSIEDMSVEEMKAQFETNVFGMFRVTRAVLPHMREQRGGAIINISSVAGRVGLPLFSAYVSTKFALEGLSESMAYELQPFGIKVAIIEPGGIKTNFRSEQAARATKNSPYYTMTQSAFKAIEGMAKQGLHPKEVAKAVLHAIDNPKPKLRYLVGKDAEELIEARRKFSDEELSQIVAQNILGKKEEEQAPPQNRGQVAAMEQVKILTDALAGAMQEQAPPQNRGQVAAQEQFKIMKEALRMSNAQFLS
jgi:NAD(P)-dependent dehydrogenase (short-subunit alcohol dehydrogenase family)